MANIIDIIKIIMYFVVLLIINLIALVILIIFAIIIAPFSVIAHCWETANEKIKGDEDNVLL